MKALRFKHLHLCIYNYTENTVVFPNNLIFRCNGSYQSLAQTWTGCNHYYEAGVLNRTHTLQHSCCRIASRRHSAHYRKT